MSSRKKDRAPSGASNVNTARKESARVPVSGRQPETNSARGSARGELSSEEIITRLRDSKNRTQFEKDQKDIALLGDYNAFSRPRASSSK